MEKVILGLSGGVDSAVSAALLRERGFAVTGLFLDIGAPEALRDAKNAAEALDIELIVRDIRAELEDFVCKPFARAYLLGETPNPCILCNPTVKFKALLETADALGARYVATGHYARAQGGRLFKGRGENDQSYMLCRLTREQVKRLLLPLGELNKSEVRRIAERMALPLAHKPDSMEICFIPDGDYAAYIERRGTVPPAGNFVDGEGNILGRHNGIHRYTVGQRRGLGIAAGKRIFVSDIRPDTNEIVLSDGEELFVDSALVKDTSWLREIDKPFEASVRVRHSRTETPALITPTEGGAEIAFKKPVRAPTAGQSAVFYIAEELVGSGFIVK